MNSVYGSLHSFTDVLTARYGSEKIGEKKFSVFTAGSIFRSISRVMGVINEFGLPVVCIHLRMRLQPDKNQKNRREKVFRFYCWQHISVHI